MHFVLSVTETDTGPEVDGRMPLPYGGESAATTALLGSSALKSEPGRPNRPVIGRHQLK